MQNDKAKFKKDFIKRLIKFSIDVIKYSAKLRSDRNLYPIADQLIRSSTSIGANVAEAKSSSSKKDFIRYFEIALKSANETKYWLILFREYTKDEIVPNRLLEETNELSNIIGSSVLTLKNKK